MTPAISSSRRRPRRSRGTRESRARSTELAIADHLCHRWPKLESTYFEAVRRLPGGYALRVHEGRRTVARYWDPIPPGRPIDYISEEEAGRFTELLDQAVDRCLPGGPAAIYLSGGLDSVSVAALAQEQLRDRDAGPLLALSLVFEHPDANEEDTQRAVATRLGLPQKIVTRRRRRRPEWASGGRARDERVTFRADDEPLESRLCVPGPVCRGTRVAR